MVVCGTDTDCVQMFAKSVSLGSKWTARGENLSGLSCLFGFGFSNAAVRGDGKRERTSLSYVLLFLESGVGHLILRLNQ